MIRKPNGVSHKTFHDTAFPPFQTATSFRYQWRIRGVSVVSNETPFRIVSKRSDQQLSQLTEPSKLRYVTLSYTVSNFLSQDLVIVRGR